MVICLIDGDQIFSESFKHICRLRTKLIMTIMHVQLNVNGFHLEFALDIIPCDRCDRKTPKTYYLEIQPTFTAAELTAARDSKVF